MALPVNIQDLLHGQTVEWDRIELKRGWNPEEIIRTVCAFANDINNWGGGYIFVGVEENNGRPQLPPAGLSPDSMDRIQKELLNLSHRVQPFYAPVSQPYVINGRHLLVIWVPGGEGDNRPYKVPTTLGQKGQNRYYVRRGASTVAANQQEERFLLEMAKRIPFDDRVHHHASIDDLSFALIREFLEAVRSDLRNEAAHMSLPELAVQMRIAAGPPEALLPLNAGLLFFSERPDRFFRGAVTDVITYADESGKQFTEKRFTGPIHHQLKNVLSYIETNVVREKVTKHADRPEAGRFFNYPMAAIEEVVANAFYHRSYELDNPVEINIFPRRMEVLSFPGPLPPVNREMLKQRRIVARNYRNRRVGDFLKELDLTEGRATGFPTIYDSMRNNGSPVPVFETDDDYIYFLALLPVHPEFEVAPEVKPEQAGNLSALSLEILAFCRTPRKRADILSHIGLTNHTRNFERHLLPLISTGLISMTLPELTTSPRQEYIITEKGMGLVTKSD